MIDFRNFYSTQSFITHPHQFASQLDNIPSDIASICKVVQGWVYHYFADEQFFGFKPPQERLPEIDTRYAVRMLTRLSEMDERPIIENRKPENRLIGCCRDFSVLFTSICRHKGMVARTRSGFASYFIPGYYVDHVMVEVWDEAGGRWIQVDPQLPAGAFPFDVQDMPADKFILGGRAWQLCRQEGANPDLFGLGPDGPDDAKGWSFIQTRLLQDVAALNKQEMLCWDEWGSLNGQTNPADALFLDKVATLTLSGNDHLPELWSLTESDSRLKVPPVIQSFSPAYPFEELPISVELPFTDGATG
jgi:hypothetical protein